MATALPKVYYKTNLETLDETNSLLLIERTINGITQRWSKKITDRAELEQIEEKLKVPAQLLSEQNKLFYEAGLRIQETDYTTSLWKTKWTSLSNMFFATGSTAVLMSKYLGGMWPFELTSGTSRAINIWWSGFSPSLSHYIESNKFAWEPSTYYKVKAYYNTLEAFACGGTLLETLAFNPLTEEQEKESTIRQLENIYLNKNSNPFLIEQEARVLKIIMNFVHYYLQTDWTEKLANYISNVHDIVSLPVILHAFTRVGSAAVLGTLPTENPIGNGIGLAMAATPAGIAAVKNIYNVLTEKAEPIVTSEKLVEELDCIEFPTNAAYDESHHKSSFSLPPNSSSENLIDVSNSRPTTSDAQQLDGGENTYTESNENNKNETIISISGQNNQNDSEQNDQDDYEVNDDERSCCIM